MIDCRCPHAPYSHRVYSDAKHSLERRAFLAGLAATGAALMMPWKAAAASGVVVIKAARLFTGTALQTPGVLVIKGDRIVSLSEGDAGSGATTIELGDATI